MPDELRTDVDTRSVSKGSGQYESELGSDVKADVIGHVGAFWHIGARAYIGGTQR